MAATPRKSFAQLANQALFSYCANISFALSNEDLNIKNIKQRLTQLEKQLAENPSHSTSKLDGTEQVFVSLEKLNARLFEALNYSKSVFAAQIKLLKSGFDLDAYHDHQAVIKKQKGYEQLIMCLEEIDGTLSSLNNRAHALIQQSRSTQFLPDQAVLGVSVYW